MTNEDQPKAITVLGTESVHDKNKNDDRYPALPGHEELRENHAIPPRYMVPEQDNAEASALH